eukprot:NODE_3971_length_1252_cov_29.312666_g3483_i0.p1 GENE.NODE_3971_length_1252_cov_29.312666_g3483_i0~~NODE_3971_length_1252_cov_29.312666_g3483_i0.p1  ORF type:complete len:349 (-),score=29.77 NODE_3971_length_1252_cov_29.312666_g3483_i0:120-1166(-)
MSETPSKEKTERRTSFWRNIIPVTHSLPITNVSSVSNVLNQILTWRKPKRYEIIPLEVPDVVLSHVMSFLPCSDLFKICSSVCSLWYEITKSPYIWKTVVQPLYPFIDDRRIIQRDKVFMEDTILFDPLKTSIENIPEQRWDSWRSGFLCLIRHPGKYVCWAQVLDKHQHPGLKLSAYDALIEYMEIKQWKAYFLPPAINKTNRAHFGNDYVLSDRLRSIPHDLLRCKPYDCYFAENLTPNHFPIKTWVEIQYRFQEGDPFGWWLGYVDKVEIVENMHHLTIRFPQYKAGSHWAYEVVYFGQTHRKTPLPNSTSKGSNAVGGIRMVTDQEMIWWSKRRKVWGAEGDIG